MTTTLDYRPTAVDSPIGSFFEYDDPRRRWVVVATQTPDSDAVSRSNFLAACRILGGESDTVEVHRYGHWGPGWVEVLIADTRHAATVQGIHDRLEDYPVLDEELLSHMEWEQAQDTWEGMFPAERTELCKQEGLDRRMARRKRFPEELYERLTD